MYFRFYGTICPYEICPLEYQIQKNDMTILFQMLPQYRILDFKLKLSSFQKLMCFSQVISDPKNLCEQALLSPYIGLFEHIKHFQFNFKFPIRRPKNNHDGVLSSSKGKQLLTLLLNRYD